ncbi:DUF1353 domain-containing protein [Thalassotalea hakodatensis]|uniref:DUF1353 domain-containing protein n=1 Tax=Thalassotalea hakodatensis TaxID=3030492 RepID=UPI00257457F4|nr:DUF1353 domain-containing protein [Thalassotalea hakodatensis]
MFSGQPLTRWLPERKVQLLEDFTFIDKQGVIWVAPKGSIVDGSSIPRWLWFFIGSPFVGKHRYASIVHDVYCVTRSRPHKDVHKMYYEACRANGVNRIKAKVMYWGIKFRGPKW